MNELSVWYLILNAGIVVKMVLVLLILMSLISWAIIANKWRVFRKIKKEAQDFSAAFWGGSDLDTLIAGLPTQYPNSPMPNMFQAGYREFQRQRQDASPSAQDTIMKIVAGTGLEGIRRTLDASLSREMARLTHSLPFLATVGSTAPFIGLFGTVWGIMNAFQNIGLTKSTSLAAVAPGIAEALVATAFGLIAAIPAVVAYNKFSTDLRHIGSELEQFASEFLNVLGRHLKR